MGLIDKAAVVVLEDTPVGRLLADESFDLGKSALRGTHVAKIFAEAQSAAKSMLGTTAVQADVSTLGHCLPLVDFGNSERLLLLPNGTQVMHNPAAAVPFTTFRQVAGKQLTYWKNGWRAISEPGKDLRFWDASGAPARLQSGSISKTGSIVHFEHNADIGGFNKIELSPSGMKVSTDPLDIKTVSESDGNKWIFHPDGRFTRQFPNGKIMMSRCDITIPPKELWAQPSAESSWSANLLRGFEHEEATMH